MSNDKQPISAGLTKAEILAKHSGHYEDMLREDFLNEPAITPKEAFAAMGEYAAQSAPKPSAGVEFAKWLEENTKIIYEDKITLYRYCDKNNEWGNYILEDIYTEWLGESIKPDESQQLQSQQQEQTNLHQIVCKEHKWGTVYYSDTTGKEQDGVICLNCGMLKMEEETNIETIEEHIAQLQQQEEAAKTRMCPKCGHDLEYYQDMLKCDNCGSTYDIPNLIVIQEQATQPTKGMCVDQYDIFQRQIEDYKYLLKTFTFCPQTIIDNPGILKGKLPTVEDVAWAQKEIKEYEENKSLIEVPLSKVQVNYYEDKIEMLQRLLAEQQDDKIKIPYADKIFNLEDCINKMSKEQIDHVEKQMAGEDKISDEEITEMAFEEYPYHGIDKEVLDHRHLCREAYFKGFKACLQKDSVAK